MAGNKQTSLFSFRRAGREPFDERATTSQHGSHSRTLMVVGLMLCSSLAGCIFEDGSSGEDAEVLAVFGFDPSKNIKVGTTVSFDGSSSTPNDGSLTYRWNWTEATIDIDATGLTASWSFDEAKTYKDPWGYRRHLNVGANPGHHRLRRVLNLQRQRSRSTPTMKTARTKRSPSLDTFSCGFVLATKPSPTATSQKRRPSTSMRRTRQATARRNTS